MRAQLPPKSCWKARPRSLVSFDKLDQCFRDTSLEERAHLQNPQKLMHQVGETLFETPFLLSLEGCKTYGITKIFLGKKKEGL